ncbi:hypothetical protein ACFX11_011022 [Malus domestica]
MAKGGTAGYGEWLKAGPIRDEMEIRRPRLLGLGEMRMAGTARDSPHRSSLRSYGGIEINGLGDSRRQMADLESGETPIPIQPGRKKWHQRSRMMVGMRNFTQEWLVPTKERQSSWSLGQDTILLDSNCGIPRQLAYNQSDRIGDTHEGLNHLQGAVEWGNTAAGSSGRARETIYPNLDGASQMKRGGDLICLDMVQSPLKKSKGRGDGNAQIGRVTAYLGGSSIPEQSQMIEHSVAAEEENRDVPVVIQNLWECVVGVSETGRDNLMKRTGDEARGGGGWPTTAARSP